jgi:predicted acylesterase/phospholipase RssA
MDTKESHTWRPKVLVMNGGAIRGIFTAGALLVLEEFGYLSQLHTYAGTSIGGIIAGLLALGFTAQEIADEFYQADFSILFQHISIGNFFKDHVCDSSWLRDFLYLCIKRKFPDDENLTLGELYNRTGKSLFVVTLRRKDNKKFLLSPKETPETLVLDAMLQTSCVPGLMEDVVIDNDVFWDGGMVDNYPVSYFDTEEVLGIYLGPRGYEQKSPVKQKPADSKGLLSMFAPKALSKIKDAIGMLMCTIEYMRLKDVYLREVYIDTSAIDSFSITMKQEEKIEYIMKGMSSALRFLINPAKKRLYDENIIHG